TKLASGAGGTLPSERTILLAAVTWVPDPVNNPTDVVIRRASPVDNAQTLYYALGLIKGTPQLAAAAMTSIICKNNCVQQAAAQGVGGGKGMHPVGGSAACVSKCDWANGTSSFIALPTITNFAEGAAPFPAPPQVQGGSGGMQGGGVYQ